MAALVGMLAAVPQLLDQLDVAISKQARVGGGGKAGKGSARETNPINFGALKAKDQLVTEVAIWGYDAALIRSGPHPERAVSGIGRAVKEAFRSIDRAQEREYLGKCGMYDEGREDYPCDGELWARPKAANVKCPKCEHVHEVAVRRVDLLEIARDYICTPREAASYVGEVGGVQVGHQRIRNYLDRGRIAERPSPDGVKRLRLGDLLDVLSDDASRQKREAS
jgi:hypothetical protein